jgi:cell division septation protein DedD
MIEIIHSQTGEFRVFPTMQAVADFLHGRPGAEHWGGHERYGKLPVPSQDAAPVAEVAATPDGGIVIASDSQSAETAPTEESPATQAESDSQPSMRPAAKRAAAKKTAAKGRK